MESRMAKECISLLYNKAGCGMLKAIRNDAWLSVCLCELSR